MHKIYHLTEYLALSPSELADTNLICPECGREHFIPIKKAWAGKGLISEIPETISTILGKNPSKVGVIYDKHIETKLDEMFFSPFDSLALSYVRVPLGEFGALLDSSVDVGDKAVADLPEGIDILLGVGSGVICDLTKWIATKKKIPFIILGTAASMNAYTSVSATIAENKIKTSVMLDPAEAVLLDSDLMASAPHEMTCAGIGDLLARNVCNADWMLSRKLRDTYFCSVPYQMMISCQEKYLSQIELLGKNDSNAMKSLSDATLVSGYSMAILDGETSSSSGSEHVISHFFDFQHEIFDLPKNLHGTQVGIGTIIMSTAYDMLREMSPSDFNVDEIVGNRISLEDIIQDHALVFGNYGAKFDSVVAKKRIPDNEFRHYLEKIFQNWNEIWEAVDPFLMPAEVIRQAMESSGSVTNLAGINRTYENAIQALLYGSHYRPRYTILDLFWELGLFPSFATDILERAKVG